MLPSARPAGRQHEVLEASVVWLPLLLTLGGQYSNFIDESSKNRRAGMNSRAKNNKSRRDLVG
jgi:hypothetical protein